MQRDQIRNINSRARLRKQRRQPPGAVPGAAQGQARGGGEPDPDLSQPSGHVFKPRKRNRKQAATEHGKGGPSGLDDPDDPDDPDEEEPEETHGRTGRFS